MPVARQRASLKRLLLAPPSVIGAAFALLTLNLIWAVLRFQPNVLAWDQWDFLQPLFDGRGAWALFDYQHGPHRQGLGALAEALTLEWSGWDTRWDSIGIVFWLALATLLALGLKQKLTGRLVLGDLWIPIAGLSLRQFETILFVPNAAHSALPLVLLLGTAHLWLAPRPAVRFLGSGAVAAMLAFTGFGCFGAVMVTSLLAASSLRFALRREWYAAAPAFAGLVVAGVGWYAFARGYVFAPAVSGFRFPWTPLVDYARFIVLLLAHSAGWTRASAAAWGGGIALAALVAGVTVALIRRWLAVREGAPKLEVCLLLVGTGVLFVASAAVGRISEGIEGGMVSRYVTLTTPIWLGLCLHAAVFGSRILRRLVPATVWLIALWPFRDLTSRPIRSWPGTFGLTTGEYATMENYTVAKAGWVDEWLKTRRIDAAQARWGDAIYPFPAATRLDEKLHFLQVHEFSFFAAPDDPGAFLPWGLAGRAIWDDHYPALDQPYSFTTHARLIFVARRAGLIALPLAASRGSSAGPVAVTVRHGDSRSEIPVSATPAILVVRVSAGFNVIEFDAPPALPGDAGTVIGGPVRPIATVPAGAVFLGDKRPDR